MTTVDSSPGFSHGFNLWCRPRNITHLSLTTHALLASLPSVCHISHLHHHAPYLRVCVFSSSALKRFCSCCIRLISNQRRNLTFVSDIYSASIEKTETVEAQRHERISPSRKGHGERALFLNER
ncbi:hypothetical protein ABG768_000146 [Culter alburnus]|uniref:Uncharacterized protein n=1 Tax=Culter alburnus TaxID=194366 RepID=A0AAW2B541_CULAL